MPQKRKARTWSELKQAGNECFKTGQYGEAVAIYSQAIGQLEKSSKFLLNMTHYYRQRRRSRGGEAQPAAAAPQNEIPQ